MLIKAAGNNDYSPDHQYDPKKDNKLIKVVKVQSGSQLLTFLSLDTMIYDDMNLFLFGDQSSAIFQLMLIEQQLAVSDHVILLGHVPPTLRGAAPEFMIVYRALIAKYSSKIKGQFFGHTHMDMLTLNTYPDHSELVTGFGFVSPSVSPFGIGVSRTRYYNFAIEPEVGVVDYTQYRSKNISSLQSGWLVDYSFRDRYNISQSAFPLTVQQMEKIKDAIIQNPQPYIQNSGLPRPRIKEKIHCEILDDPASR